MSPEPKPTTTSATPPRPSTNTKRCLPPIPPTSTRSRASPTSICRKSTSTEAKQYYNKAVQIDPNDPESYYSVAFIDWSQASKFRQDERNKLGMKATDELNEKKTCALVKENNAPIVEEGIGLLNKALKLRPDTTTPWPIST